MRERAKEDVNRIDYWDRMPMQEVSVDPAALPGEWQSADARREKGRDEGRQERNSRSQSRRKLTKRERREQIRRRKRRRRQQLIARTVLLLAGGILLALLAGGLWRVGSMVWERYFGLQSAMTEEERAQIIDNHSKKPEIMEDFLTPNPYSRPQEALPEVHNLFVHYTANAGTSAAQNRSYFENLGITGETSASAHFVIGYEGEIIQCLPLDEIGYAVKEHNYDSISIECCYLDESGVFTRETYQSLIKLLGWLMKEYGLSTKDVLRHYDAGGKACPKYYVEESRWTQLLEDLDAYVTSG